MVQLNRLFNTVFVYNFNTRVIVLYTLTQMILLVVALILLERGADWLVEGSSGLARKFKVSDLFIGLTIVAFGTSAPELAVSVIGALQHSGGISIGNVVGSNIANVALVLGSAIIVGSGMIIKKQTLQYEIPLMLLAQLVASMMLLKDGYLDYHNGIVLLSFFAIFLVYVLSTSKNGFEEICVKERSLSAYSLLTAIGMAGVTAGGELSVYSAVNLARSFHVSETLIATTIIAFGTSIPELATSIKAALKSKKDLAVGNVVGSNLFNILAILGISSLLSPIKPDRNVTSDLIFMNVTGILLLFLFLNRKHIAKKWKGILLLLIYASYIIYEMFVR